MCFVVLSQDLVYLPNMNYFQAGRIPRILQHWNQSSLKQKGLVMGFFLPVPGMLQTFTSVMVLYPSTAVVAAAAENKACFLLLVVH